MFQDGINRARGVRAIYRAVEALERRSLFSSTVDVGLVDGVLMVTGGIGDDQITVSLTPGGSEVVVAGGGNVVAVLPVDEVESLVVTGGGGDDTVAINTAGEAGEMPFSTQVVVGDGLDTVVGGDPSDIIAARDGVISDLVAWTRNTPTGATTALLPAWTGQLEDGAVVVNLEDPVAEPDAVPVSAKNITPEQKERLKSFVERAYQENLITAKEREDLQKLIERDQIKELKKTSRDTPYGEYHYSFFGDDEIWIRDDMINSYVDAMAILLHEYMHMKNSVIGNAVDNFNELVGSNSIPRWREEAFRNGITVDRLPQLPLNP